MAVRNPDYKKIKNINVILYVKFRHEHHSRNLFDYF